MQHDGAETPISELRLVETKSEGFFWQNENFAVGMNIPKMNTLPWGGISHYFLSRHR